MPRKDIHDKPFDETTISKLEIFEDYVKAWLPTFVMQGRSEIHLFDFFAGTGYDINGVKGSPIRILDKIQGQIGNIFQKKVKVTVHLNEFEPNRVKQKKYDLLKEACEKYLTEYSAVNRAISIKYYNEDCEALFPKLLPIIKDYPSLVFLDQNGIKFLSDQYFLELEKCKETDFLYFVSSSYFWRFGNQKTFKLHLDIDVEEAKKNPYKFIHESVLQQLRQKLPANSDLKLYPFSLKKGSNIHGIIFGASHPRAVDKFLTIAWKRNSINGQANFDINDDRHSSQLTIFGKSKSKMELFQESVKENILNQSILNNYMLYDYTLDSGHIGKHSADVLREMKKQGKITYEGRSPLVTYENVYKKNKKISYNLK